MLLTPSVPSAMSRLPLTSGLSHGPDTEITYDALPFRTSTFLEKARRGSRDDDPSRLRSKRLPRDTVPPKLNSVASLFRDRGSIESRSSFRRATRGDLLEKAFP